MEELSESVTASEAESVKSEHPQGRKRLRLEPNWVKNKQKWRKDMGKAYETIARNGNSNSGHDK